MTRFSNYFYIIAVFTFLFNPSVNETSPTEQPKYVEKKVVGKWQFGKLLNSIAKVNKQRLNALITYTNLDKHRAVDGILRLKDEGDPMVAVLFINKNDPSATKLYEIHDSDLTNAPGDTTVRDIIQQIEDYYDDDDDDYENESEDNISEKLYSTNHIVRERKTTMDDASDENEMIPSKNNVQDETSDGEEIGSKSGNVANMMRPGKIAAKAKMNKKGTGNSNVLEMKEKQILRIFASCTKKAIKMCKKSCTAAGKEVCNTFKCSSSMKKTFKKYCKSECKSNFSKR